MTARFPVTSRLLFSLSLALLISGCGGNGSSDGSSNSTPNPPPPPAAVNEWTWMSGSDAVNAVGVYGTLGVASANNVPGARSGSVSWTDANGNLWLFGGNWYSYSSGASSLFNDLWEFSPSTKEWTWVSGTNTASSVSGGPVTVGIYGTEGTASASNMPGPRDSAASWIDSSGNLWLFGGWGYASTSTAGELNDLWKFSPANKEWTWVSGSNTINAPGVYGTQGVASPSNVPRARGDASEGAPLSWTDKSGNLWLFGGGTTFNDLWEFNPSTKEWTWISGSSTPNAAGVYGTQGVASALNTPGARGLSVAWTDSSGNFWLFGGGGFDSTDTITDLNDLWEFNPNTKEWTWVSGSSTGGVLPIYGTEGVPSASNTPGGRDSSVGWIDSSGNLWLFGGFDADGPIPGTSGAYEYLNDLWKFSPTTKQWVWVNGSDTGNAKGVYGTLGFAATSNVPGARGSEGVPVAWTDSSGNFWLFGGVGTDSVGGGGDLNDLWRYQP